METPVTPFYSLPLAAALVLFLAYGFWLSRLLRQLDRKLDRLEHYCQACRREMAAQLAGRLEYDPEHTGLWEALHYREHPPPKPPASPVKIVGQS